MVDTIFVYFILRTTGTYDGPKEYTRKGSGFCSSPVMFCEPLGFTLSFVVLQLDQRKKYNLNVTFPQTVMNNLFSSLILASGLIT